MLSEATYQGGEQAGHSDRVTVGARALVRSFQQAHHTSQDALLELHIGDGARRDGEKFGECYRETDESATRWSNG